MVKLGDLIKTKRESMGLSLREFAERCDMSHSYIKNLEDGDPRTGRDITPTINCLEKLAPAFSMSLEELLNEIGYINITSKFELSNLKLIRGPKSYEEVSQEIAAKTGEKTDPTVYEALEKGLDKNPSVLFVDMLAKYAGVNRTFFYRKNTPDTLEYARTNEPYCYIPQREQIPTYVNSEFIDFISDPSNEEYLKLAIELKDKNLKVRFVREILFEK